MKVALFLDSARPADKVFDTSPDNRLRLTGMLDLWLSLKEYLRRRGAELHTWDIYGSLEEIDKAIFFSLYAGNAEHLQRLNRLGRDCYYVALEPPVVHHFNHRRELLSLAPRFKKILTYQDDLLDGRKFLRLPVGWAPPDASGVQALPFAQREFMLLINSYRYANHHAQRELYSERFRAARFFQAHHPGFHVYGWGFNDPARVEKRWPHKPPLFLASYAGAVERKLEVMARYRFCLCFENCTGVYGYISEKIFHAMLAGTVPVYWGAPNVQDYIPEDCFIDRRRFRDYAELLEFLLGIDEAAFQRYQRAMRDYLASERFRRDFGLESWIQTLWSALAD